MRKIAIFVEGQTELITVREFLLRKYNYEVSFDCYAPHKEGNFKPAEYHYENPNAKTYYQIFNVGNDQRVLSAILEREASLFSNGFEKVIGLRDMYSSVYKEISPVIDDKINADIIKTDKESTEKRSTNSKKINLCYAIMEIESWFLALHHIFQKIHNDLTIEFIKEKLKIDLSNVNPETEFFHPANTIKEIYGLVALRYDKSKGDIESFCSHLKNEDFSNLYSSPKCSSFNIFHDCALA